MPCILPSNLMKCWLVSTWTPILHFLCCSTWILQESRETWPYGFIWQVLQVSPTKTGNYRESISRWWLSSKVHLIFFKKLFSTIHFHLYNWLMFFPAAHQVYPSLTFSWFCYGKMLPTAWEGYVYRCLLLPSYGEIDRNGLISRRKDFRLR